MLEVLEKLDRTILVIIAVSISALIGVVSVTAYAPNQYTGYQSQSNIGPGMMGQDMMQGGMMGPGMMKNTSVMPSQGYGNYTQEMSMMDQGMMMDGVPMMSGMMGYYSDVPTALTHENVVQIAENYLVSINNPDLVIDEFEEYSHNFYVSIVKQSTGRGALEIIIDRYTGPQQFEPQSMMWNTNYGMTDMMGGIQRNTLEMTVTSDEAMRTAQDFLDVAFPDTMVSEIVAYYGYYTIMTTLNGEHYGMLSVNGYSGEIWYHTWHGMFISEIE